MTDTEIILAYHRDLLVEIEQIQENLMVSNHELFFALNEAYTNHEKTQHNDDESFTVNSLEELVEKTKDNPQGLL